MTEKNKKEVNDLIHSIGLKYNLQDNEIKEIVESQFKFTYETIRELDLNVSFEEFENMKKVFLFKFIGKLFINEANFKRINERKNEARES